MKQQGEVRAVPAVYEAAPDQGLTAAQAAERANAGCRNLPVAPPSKTVGKIILSNVFTYFNMLFTLLALCVAAVRSWLDLTFMGVILVNTLIGIVQELRSKRVLDRLNILTAPKAKVVREGRTQTVATDALVRDDIVCFAAGDQIPADAVVVAGTLQVNEALVTGEADEIDKQPGDALLSGSFAVSGEARARLTAVGADSFAAKLTLEARQGKKPRQSEMMRSLTRLVKIIGIIVIPFGVVLFCKETIGLGRDVQTAVTSTVAAVIGMIPEGLYLLTSLALMAGILRLARKKTLLHDMASIETLARVDVLCVDKTGTITENKMTVEDLALLREQEYDEPAVREVLRDYVFAMSGDNETMAALKRRFSGRPTRKAVSTLPFSSTKKYGGVDFGGGDCWLLGAPEVLLKLGYADYQEKVEYWAEKGCRVLLLARYAGTPDDDLSGRVTAVALVLLSNKIRVEAADTFAYFASQGVAVKVISGDSPVTVSEVARRAGIPGAEKYVDARTLTDEPALKAAAGQYTVFGRVTPEQKRSLVLALKAADCGVALASGSDVACRTANIVLLNSDFSNMPGVVQEGRRVINNIERSASLYLVKNIFSFCLALITLCFALPYPFGPAGLSIVNALAIGIPSFVLAMEPNHSLVTGRFLPNVLYRALPAALTDLVLILGVLLFYQTLGLSEEGLKTVATAVMGVVGFYMVDRVSRPYTGLRRAMLVVIVAAFAVAFLFFKEYFTLDPIGKADWLVLIVFALLAKPAMNFFGGWLDRLRSWLRAKQEDLDL